MFYAQCNQFFQFHDWIENSFYIQSMNYKIYVTLCIHYTLTIVLLKLFDLHSAKECNIVKASLILFNAPNAALSTSFVGLVFVLLEFNIRIIATPLTYLVP